MSPGSGFAKADKFFLETAISLRIRKLAFKQNRIPEFQLSELVIEKVEFIFIISTTHEYEIYVLY